MVNNPTADELVTLAAKASSTMDIDLFCPDKLRAYTELINGYDEILCAKNSH